MKITKERFRELGLGVCKDACKCCESCDIDKHGKYICIDTPVTIDIEKAEQNFEFSPCLDEQRLSLEMTDEEYDDYRHGRLEVDMDHE